MWREIKQIIHQKQRFLLTTHVNPDGDGIGAACALTELLLGLGKDVQFVCDSPIPRKFSFLDYHHIHAVYDPQMDFSSVEVMIILDTHRKERVGRLASLLDNPALTVICIDHHTLTDYFTPYNAIDPSSCSVGAMIHTLFKEMGQCLEIQAATGIYASVICDTGRFSYSSTSRKAHKIAEECIKLGVDPDLMYSRLFQHVSLAEIRMFAKALQRMEIHLDNRVVVQQIYQDDYEQPNKGESDLEHIDLEYILDFNKLIEDVECVVLLRELSDQHVRVSIRCKGNIDIGQILRPVGGGGHCHAAGVSWKGTMEEVKAKILKLLQNAIPHDNPSPGSRPMQGYDQQACSG